MSAIQISRAAQNSPRLNCHRERAAQPGVERSKSAKPTLQPSACVSQPTTHPGGSRFVANKDSNAIRPNGHRTVEALFSSFNRSPIWLIADGDFGAFCCPVGRSEEHTSELQSRLHL